MTQQGGELDVLGEYEGAELGDVRRVRRLKQLAGDMNKEPASSFPMATEDSAALEGTYRFFSNSAVTPEGILAGHGRKTAERAGAYRWVVAIHDTSNFEFGGEAPREGLGPMRGKGQGFLGHLTLVVGGGDGRPLGVVTMQALTRSKKSRKKMTPKQRREDPNNESRRWWKGVEQAEALLVGTTSVVHVMDREGDSYELLARLHASGRRFVVRALHDRPLEGEEPERLFDALDNTTTIVERLVPLSRRSDHGRELRARQIHPARTTRVARLAISATSVSPKRSRHVPAAVAPASLRLHAVRVREVETNGDHEPVEWRLLTTEPIESPADVERIVDIYRTRWLIEEYFKALKTGCAIEKRQLESKHALLNALALFIPIAWRLLRLRTLARDDADAPATEALSAVQVEVLVATSKKHKLPPKPTVRQALLAVAALGGHIKNNGEPGWMVLGRGYDKLLTMETAWRAARGCDQS